MGGHLNADRTADHDRTFTKLLTMIMRTRPHAACCIMANICFWGEIYELLSSSDEHKFSSMPPTNPKVGKFIFIPMMQATLTKGELSNYILNH